MIYTSILTLALTIAPQLSPQNKYHNLLDQYISKTRFTNSGTPIIVMKGLNATVSENTSTPQINLPSTFNQLLHQIDQTTQSLKMNLTIKKEQLKIIEAVTNVDITRSIWANTDLEDITQSILIIGDLLNDSIHSRKAQLKRQSNLTEELIQNFSFSSINYNRQSDSIEHSSSNSSVLEIANSLISFSERNQDSSFYKIYKQLNEQIKNLNANNYFSRRIAYFEIREIMNVVRKEADRIETELNSHYAEQNRLSVNCYKYNFYSFYKATPINRDINNRLTQLDNIIVKARKILMTINQLHFAISQFLNKIPL